MAKPENVTCPDCGGQMVRRVNRKDQTSFWGCVRFPECRGTRNSEGEVPRKRRDDDGDQEPDTRLPSERARQNDRRRW